jgi:hypothetical protein
MPRRSALTYGEAITLCARYHSGGGSLLRFTATRNGQVVDEVFGAALEECSDRDPWVATLWAARRVQELRSTYQGLPSEDQLYFETRLCERFAILGPGTAALALEPGMERSMPALVGPGNRAVGSPLAQLSPRPAQDDGGTNRESDGESLFERAERMLLNRTLLQPRVPPQGPAVGPTRGPAAIPHSAPVVRPPSRPGGQSPR